MYLSEKLKPIDFFRFSKVRNMLNHGSMGQVQIKEYYFMLSFTFSTFFYVFYHKIEFLSFSLMKYPQQNINQWQTVLHGFAQFWSINYVLVASIYKNSELNMPYCERVSRRDLQYSSPECQQNVLSLIFTCHLKFNATKQNFSTPVTVILWLLWKISQD